MAAHYDHGHTPAAWTGVIISFVGFCAAGVFIVAADPVPFWISMGVVLLGPLVGGIMKSMGMGRKTQVTVPADATAERAEREQAAAHA
ncbi:HGxxPAAW family protein [Streptomyces sp. NPDC021020]|uniref:HGxxPAAW family protein n=1 Tax=Streptomyces sp. NPDC021020 TaxID=3365109 RepID=UPI00379E5EFA